MRKKVVRGFIISMALVALLGGAVITKSQSKAANVIDNDVSAEKISVDKKSDNESEGILSDDMTVEEMKEYFIKQGYKEEDLEMAYLCTTIEDIKEECKEEEEVIEEVDETVEEWILASSEDIATCSNPMDNLKASIAEIWYNFKYNEKRAYIMHPAKAFVSYVLGQDATNYTIQVFGINGLGDPSDAFRHALWCALMSRDIGHKYCDLFATAHENAPARGEIDIMADGYRLEDHKAMDLHNNEVGMSLVSDGENKENTSDEVLIRRVLNTFSRTDGSKLVWLHS